MIKASYRVFRKLKTINNLGREKIGCKKSWEKYKNWQCFI